MIIDYIKTIPQFIIPKYALTLYAGFMASRKIRVLKNRLIRRFIQKYGVNMQEAQKESIEDYACFNDFFIRRLKPECRPVAAADIVSPVDGRVSEIGTIVDGQLLQAKGRYYSVQELLACDQTVAEQFTNGHFATLYLAPKDYHRVHMPMDAMLQEMTYVPGKLFSVQPTTARVIPQLFAKNERLVVLFETTIGRMAMVLVGAAIVGNIGTTWHGEIRRSRKLKNIVYSSTDNTPTALQKAMEMGYFKLGSTVILLFSNDAHMAWRSTIHAGDDIRFGEAMGDII